MMKSIGIPFTTSTTRCSHRLWLAMILATTGPPTLAQDGEQRLENIQQRVENARRDRDVPGVVLAIVADDEVNQLQGLLRLQTLEANPGAILGDLSSFFTSIDVLEMQDYEGTRVAVLELRNEDAPTVTWRYDVTNHRVLSSEFRESSRWMGGSKVPRSLLFSDYQSFDGFDVPTSIVIHDAVHGETEIRISNVTPLEGDNSESFTLSDD